MSYRSDIAIHIRDIDFEKLRDIEDYELQDFLDNFSVKKYDDDTVTLHAEYIKWFPFVDEFKYSLTDKKIPYIYISIGENLDDIEQIEGNINDGLEYLYDNAPIIERNIRI